MARKVSKSRRRPAGGNLLSRVPPEVRLLIGGAGALGVLHYLGKKLPVLQGPMGDLAAQARARMTQVVQEGVRSAFRGMGVDAPGNQPPPVMPPHQEPPARVIDAEFEIVSPEPPI